MSVNFFNITIKAKQFFAGALIVLMFLVSSPLVVNAQAVDGETGTPGTEGTPGVEGTEGSDNGETIPVTSDNNLEPAGTDTEEGAPGPDAEEITGGQVEQGSNVTIETGDATAGGELSTDVNSNEVQSLLASSTASTTEPLELDNYTLTATGTNDAIVSNTGTTTAVTGNNTAEAARSATIETGDALSVLNIANILNTNVINSTGFMYLLNQMLEGTLALDLQDLFFPGGTSALSGAQECNLISCAAEDITYNLLQTNTATITNDANIDAVSGRNVGEADTVIIETGDTFGAANVINIANTNIIDSNYRLLAVNGLGTLNGDLVLPSETLFRAFFGMANGMAQAGFDGKVLLNDNNVNLATVNNNLNTIADTGSNNATTSIGGDTDTGIGHANSNVINEVNHNLFGGDSLYMLVRVHGSWNGNVFGLPEGLSWVETEEGIVIYNTDAEIVPSEILQYDIDSYTANFNNNNAVAIDNNININSVSGQNDLIADIGAIQTGNSYAGANVLNVANTNVVGRNWVMAIMNIFGDFNGNISFGRPDLWVGGQVQSESDPVGPGSKLVYTYTVKNNGDLKATNVSLAHTLHFAHIRYQGNNGEELQSANRTESIGTLLPGESRVVSFDAYVDENIPVGDSIVNTDAVLTLRESDSNNNNNHERLDVPTHRPPQYSQGSYGGGGGTGTTTPPYSQGSYGGGTGTTTTGTTTPPAYSQGSYYGQGSYAPAYSQGSYSSGGGGGGGGSSNKPKAKVLGVTKSKIDPNKAPLITIKKTADISRNKRVAAGQEVKYKVVVKNDGGLAYNAKVFDRLLNPIGALVSEQSWDLGTIGAGEVITLDYTTKYENNTPSGLYTNTASIVAYKKPNDPKTKLKIADAVYKLEVVKGQALGIGNVEVLRFIPAVNGQSSALITWETSKPADGQAFFSQQGLVSPYNKNLPNYGYQRNTLRLPALTTKHYMLLPGLTNGTTYVYRLRSAGADHVAQGGDYTVTVPGVAPVVATTPSWVKPTAKVAGAATSVVPVTAPAPVAKPNPLPTVGGFVNQVKNNLFNFFH